MEQPKELSDIYKLLFNKYQPQGWWPIVRNGKTVYGLNAPRNDKEIYEIIIGAILTQNTSWKNVEKALASLENADAINPGKIIQFNMKELEKLIKPSGFNKQKAKRLKDFTGFIMLFGSMKKFKKNITRDQLLKQKGIGPETADSILLYACRRPEFVVDAYTRRIFSRIGMIKKDAGYNEVKILFETNCPKDQEVFSEYHALIIEHAKQFCQKKPICNNCPIENKCKKIV